MGAFTDKMWRLKQADFGNNSFGPMMMPNQSFPGGNPFLGPSQPLARPGGITPGAAPYMREVANQSVPEKVLGAVGSGLGKVGGAIGDVAGYLTDEKQGALRQAMLMNMIGTVANIYEANQRGKEADEDKRRKRKRAAVIGPELAKLMRELQS